MESFTQNNNFNELLVIKTITGETYSQLKLYTIKEIEKYKVLWQMNHFLKPLAVAFVKLPIINIKYFDGELYL